MEHIFRIIIMLKLFYYKVLDAIMGKTNKRKEDAEIIDLVVTDKGHTEIPLESLPRLIEIKFKDSSGPTPCDPHHDKLHHEVHRRKNKYFLIVKWHVSSVREVIGAIYF
jgi:hypothetical protein